MGIYDVPIAYLIEETAEKLKTDIEEPEFTKYVKTGVHRERAPQRDDWFYVRMASILYRAYKWNVIGTERLRSYYGGKRNRGVKEEHQYKASGKVIRSAVQKLEAGGYLEKAQPKGRKLTPKGQKLLNENSKLVVSGIEAGKYTKKVKVKKEDAKEKAVHEELKKQSDDKKAKEKAVEAKKKEKPKAKA
ncbi:MAG: 40S ribosomal protein S19, partial [Candidatus Diapherotrites archaeon]|nr:40S ribosomal protein S19 [Candidatus Diapherotrites archaeon]